MTAIIRSTLTIGDEHIIAVSTAESSGAIDNDTEIFPCVPTRPVAAIAVEAASVEIHSNSAEKFAEYLSQRGLEISFEMDFGSGLARLLIIDPISGRTVAEIPSGSALEAVAMQIIDIAS